MKSTFEDDQIFAFTRTCLIWIGSMQLTHIVTLHVALSTHWHYRQVIFLLSTASRIQKSEWHKIELSYSIVYNVHRMSIESTVNDKYELQCTKVVFSSFPLKRFVFNIFAQLSKCNPKPQKIKIILYSKVTELLLGSLSASTFLISRIQDIMYQVFINHAQSFQLWHL
jgi:hypothetical protein